MGQRQSTANSTTTTKKIRDKTTKSKSSIDLTSSRKLRADEAKQLKEELLLLRQQLDEQTQSVAKLKQENKKLKVRATFDI